MIHTLIKIKVPDYHQWRSVFDGLAELRAEYGCRGGHVFTNPENPNEVVILLEWDDADQARAYTTSPELRAGMKEAGLMGPPEVSYLEEMEHAPV